MDRMMKAEQEGIFLLREKLVGAAAAVAAEEMNDSMEQ